MDIDGLEPLGELPILPCRYEVDDIVVISIIFFIYLSYGNPNITPTQGRWREVSISTE